MPQVEEPAVFYIQKGRLMKRRPVCLVCLLLMLCIWLMDLAGFARISGNPLPESVQLYIEKHPEAVICGEVQQYQDRATINCIFIPDVVYCQQKEMGAQYVKIMDTGRRTGQR